MCTKEYSRKWRAAHPGYDRAWYAKNAESQRQRGRKRAAEYAAAAHERGRKWRIENPHRNAAKERKREAAKRHRVPKWLTTVDLRAIEVVYQAAAKLTTQTGIKHVVDHYYPLQGGLVSGLHVPQNLHVIPAAQNARKSNQHPEGLKWLPHPKNS